MSRIQLLLREPKVLILAAMGFVVLVIVLAWVTWVNSKIHYECRDTCIPHPSRVWNGKCICDLTKEIR